MTFDERIVTKTPPAATFHFLSDLGNAVSWDPAMTKVEQLTPGPIGIGTRFRATLRMLGLKTTLENHVEVYEPARRIVFFGRGGGATVTDTVLVTPFRGGSRVRWIAEIKLLAPLRLLDPVFSMFYRPNVKAAVANLQGALDRVEPPQEHADDRAQEREVDADVVRMNPPHAPRAAARRQAGMGAGAPLH